MKDFLFGFGIALPFVLGFIGLLCSRSFADRLESYIVIFLGLIGLSIFKVCGYLNEMIKIQPPPLPPRRFN